MKQREKTATIGKRTEEEEKRRYKTNRKQRNRAKNILKTEKNHRMT